jgi:acyl-CoA dehydrogenase
MIARRHPARQREEGSMGILFAILVVATVVALLFVGRGFAAWTLGSVFALVGWALAGVESPWLFTGSLLALAGLALVFGWPNLRRRLVTVRVMPIVAGLLPRLGDTERLALEAGTLWWDGELFSGDPDWRKLLDFEPKPLSSAERAFLDGPVEELCAMLDDWQASLEGDLPEEVWAFLREHRFFGMIIPAEQGGLGFSAIAHSAVVTKLASRSIAAAITVMVPNSLGPAELLLHYGTDEQKRHYLPRLAGGEEIPCFALTGPEAGSDAAATQSEGVVCYGKFEGEEVLGMRLKWRKRYITLGPIATLIGLAFKLRDPEHLIGDVEDLGITCALIPADLPGIEIGKRHDPLGVPFQNGPNEGRDVFVPLDFIIGGREMAGHGWRMLMESLAAGRSISLPALSVGAAQLAARMVSAYGMVREQFDTPIGRFEGVEEPLARIGGLTYTMSAARTLTAGAVDAGEKPAVISAVVKAYLTEGMRAVVNDAMDIRAGAAICRGPRNIIARAFVAAPIGVTVEGANILTRSMIIYGQGAIRCHPFALEEIEAVATDDLERFDSAFFGHVGFALSSAARALVLGLTGGRSARRPVVAGPAAPWFGRLTRTSAAFALVSDACMLTLGGKLKRREKITGRLADVLAWMYLGSATLKRFCDAGQPERERPFVEWACTHALFQCQEALAGVLANLPNRAAAWALSALVFPTGQRLRPPTDAQGAAVASTLLDDPAARDALTADIYRPAADEPGLGSLEAALAKAVAALDVEAKIRGAVRAGQLDRAPGHELADSALEAGIISAEEHKRVHDADEARDEVIQVDAFDPAESRGLRR